jgi:hypothetical protein
MLCQVKIHYPELADDRVVATGEGVEQQTTS